MNEQVWFRLTLALVFVMALTGWGAWGWQLRTAAQADYLRESRQAYQREWEERCKNAPNLPACITNDEYVLGQAQGLLEAMKYREQASTIVPWATGAPIGILLLFFLVRWILTGRLRPLWTLSQSLSKAKSS